MNIIALLILSSGVLFFLISLPLVYRKVPMNYLYGFRLRAAFESDQRWYDVNAYGGRQTAAWSWLIIAFGMAGFFVPGRDIPVYTKVSPIVVVLAVAIPVIRVVLWSRRLPPEAVVSQTAQTVPSETVQAPGAPLARVFLKKSTLIPACVLGLLCVGYLIFVAHSAAWLPARVATHFGAGGRADGWMSRESYLHFIAGLGLTASFSIVVVAVILTILQNRLKSFRRAKNRPLKRNPNLSWFCGDMLWLACLVLGFIAGIHYLTIEANRHHPAHLPMVPFSILIAGFIAGNIGWIILLNFHLTRKSNLSPSIELTPKQQTDLPHTDQT